MNSGMKTELKDSLSANDSSSVKTAPSKRRKISNHSEKSVPKPKGEPSVKEEWIELPHGLGRQLIESASQLSTNGKASTKIQPSKIIKTEESGEKQPSTSEPRKKGKHPYGLTPGASPFPEYMSPSAEDCEEVHRLLSEVHGARLRPKVIPRASATVTGCGEVPFVLDAVLRTLLSANTSGRNSAMALKGLINAFGSVDDSPNWDAVRQAPLPAVIESIRRGGLANVKATNIKAILDTVYERNVKGNQKAEENKDLATTTKPGPKQDIIGQNPLLRIDYISKMSDDDAMIELVSLPGIGVKTAACVLMFNMGRDVFAVDTHIYRLCQWLGWLPETKGMTRDKAFSHLEVRIPNHLKYPLHKQLILHGRECVRCRANTSPSTQGWDDAVCPIENLVKRAGPMKSGKRAPKSRAKGTGSPKQGQRRRRQSTSDEDSDSSSEEGDEE